MTQENIIWIHALQTYPVEFTTKLTCHFTLSTKTYTKLSSLTLTGHRNLPMDIRSTY